MVAAVACRRGFAAAAPASAAAAASRCRRLLRLGHGLQVRNEPPQLRVETQRWHTGSTIKAALSKCKPRRSVITCKPFDKPCPPPGNGENTPTPRPRSHLAIQRIQCALQRQTLHCDHTYKTRINMRNMNNMRRRRE